LLHTGNTFWETRRNASSGQKIKPPALLDQKTANDSLRRIGAAAPPPPTALVSSKLSSMTFCMMSPLRPEKGLGLKAIIEPEQFMISKGPQYDPIQMRTDADRWYRVQGTQI
jgi:hypothetical protein